MTEGAPGSRMKDAEFGNGTAFRELGDFVRDEYLQFEYTRGATQEANFIRKVLDLPAGARLLDVACGIGRHAHHLRRHHDVVGADLSRGLLEAARRHAPGVDVVQAEARHLPFRSAFDGAISMCEGAFGLLGGDEAHVAMLRSVRAALKPGARFLLQAMSAFYMAFDDLFDPITNVMLDDTRAVSPEGKARTFRVATRAFTPREVLAMGEAAGFRPLAVYGGITGAYRERPFKVSDAEMLILFEAAEPGSGMPQSSGGA